MKKILALCAFISFVPFIGFAQHAGPITPTGYSTAGTGAGWSNLSGVLAIDNNPAYADLAQYPTCNNFLCFHSDTAYFTHFGFSVPDTVTITGIKLDILQRVNSPGGGIHDSLLTLIVNGVAAGNNKASAFNWLDTPTNQTYGDSTDLWGATWVPAQINDTSFGFQYQLTNTSYDQTASVDFLTMTVYYEIPQDTSTAGIVSQTSSPWQVAMIGSQLTINAYSTLLSAGSQISVRDLTGKVIYSANYLSGNNRINTLIDASGWINGIYIVSIKPVNGNDYQQRVVLVK